jgi:hypothetical protein
MSSHHLISKKDVDQLGNYIGNIMKEVNRKHMELIEPHEDEIRKISSIILNFTKENKRKIYGGYALNLLIVDRNPADAIYLPEDIPDIDFYSPEPLKDLVKLCNTIYKAGFTGVTGKEALHKETYSIRVKGQLYCDISYVPRNIYNRMPFREINGLYVIGPEFMIIDYYRMLTDFTSFWRFNDKNALKRFYLLQKYYPWPQIKSPINIPPPSDPPENVNKLLNNIFQFVQPSETCIVIGFYAYDQFLKNSGILSANTPASKKFKYLEIPYYEIVSTEYKEDSLNLIGELKRNNPDLVNDIHVTEQYPFFQLLGYSAHIYYKGTLIAKIFSNNKRCIPYTTVPSDYFKNRSISRGTSTINIGTLSTVILYALITIMKARVDQDKSTRDLYYTFISHIIEMKNYFFEKTGKTIYDKSIFQELVIDCKGIPVTPEEERRLIIEYRKKKNKKYTFTYDPSQDTKVDEFNYIFANSSGNPIKNIKNLKLTAEAKEGEPNEELEDQEDNPNVKIE